MAYGSEHPEFAEEQGHLASTISTIDRELERTSRPSEASPVYRNAARSMGQLTEETLARLREARPAPYFARVDFRPDGSTQSLSRIYIGKHGVRDGVGGPIVVHEWRAPIAQLFYRNRLAGAWYETNQRGRISGTVSLRRQFRIRECKLDSFSDERLGAGEPTPELTSPTRPQAAAPSQKLSPRETAVNGLFIDDVLREILDEHRDPGLRDIVTTIQAEQYAAIEAPLDRMLIVQGVAGSGKTSVALHRLAYLLHRHADQLTARNTLVLAPSQLFLGAIAHILPTLDEPNVQQMTFTQWACRLLGIDVAVDDVLMAIEDTADARVQHFAHLAHRGARRLKGSLLMRDLVDAYLRVLGRRHVQRAISISFDYTLPADDRRIYDYTHPDASITVSLDTDAVAAIIDEYATGARGARASLSERRRWAIDRLIEAGWEQLQRAPEYNAPYIGARDRGVIMEARFQAFNRVAGTAVERQVERWWPSYTPPDIFAGLTSSGTDLDAAVSDLHVTTGTSLSPAERVLLLRPSSQSDAATSLEPEDLPILSYIDLCLHGQHLSPYDHVIIDEAQDWSPLQLWVVAQHTRGRSMTLVGDVAQALDGGSTSGWDELAQAVPDATILRHELRTSYRSTAEITLLANHVLQGAQPQLSIEPAQPVARSGVGPRFIKCEAHAGLIQVAQNTLVRTRKRGARSVAILCRSGATCRLLADDLGSGTDAPQLVLSKDAGALGSAVLMPVHLAKGLEFDTVILADADEVTYGTDPEDAKLLYVALTRALHELFVLWVGNRTPLLSSGKTRPHPSNGGR